jgi:hypothetical protein
MSWDSDTVFGLRIIVGLPVLQFICEEVGAV